MTARVTGLTASLSGLMALALFLGLLSGRPELFLVAVPLAVRLLSSALWRGAGDCSLTHHVSAERVFDGDRLRVTVTLTARSRLPLVELLEPLPPSVELASGHNRSVFSVEAGRSVRWSYELRCVGRSRFTLGTVYARIWEPAGLRVAETRYLDPKPVRVYPRIAPINRLPQPLWTQTGVGNYVSPALGEGLEPGDIRPFAPGDRVKHVNWRASLRLGRIYVTRHQQERNADVVLMLDTLSQVGVPPTTSLDLCAQAAASLARAYLARKDRVGLIEYGGVLRWVKPSSGRPQFERLLDYLLNAQAVFTYVAKDLAMVPPRVLPPQSLVIALSPLIDDRFVEAVEDLSARGFDVVVLSVCPIAITRAALPPSALTDVVCRLWELERQARLLELRRLGLAIADWHPAEPLELALGSFRRHRRWRRAMAV
jgi:uncharacterized protein (DUF58 family)